jgi:hypothetical protein
MIEYFFRHNNGAVFAGMLSLGAKIRTSSLLILNRVGFS